jgi:perosamine synthetase
MPFEREHGIQPAEDMIPLSVPNIVGNEWRYVKECLDTGWVSSVGSYVDRFEEEFADVVGARHAVCVSSGTAALHLALVASGVQAGDEVIVPALTFIAPANAVRYLGAFPTFIDVTSSYWQLDPERLAEFLRDHCTRTTQGLVNARTGRRVTTIAVVDILGHPADLDAIHALAAEFELAVVEDATESLGARYKGRMIGTVSRLSCFSFNGNKLLTTGGGGMVTTDDGDLARRIKYLSTQAKDDPIEFAHGDVGYNYRLTNVQAAIGCAQLEQLSDFLSAKRRIAARYDEALARVPGVGIMPRMPWADPAFWLYTVRLDNDTGLASSRPIMRAMECMRVQTRPLWEPLHRSKAHRPSYASQCPVAEELQTRCLCLPCSTQLTNEDQARVIDAFRDALKSADPMTTRSAVRA